MRALSKPLALAAALVAAGTAITTASKPEPLATPPAVVADHFTGEIVAMRRLTETQYRNSIADIFGPEIEVAGRFEPIVRPVHEMLSSGATFASISPTGLEQYDAMARNIARQAFGSARRMEFVPCTPADAARADDGCAAATLTPLGRYIFRRPLTKEEQAFFVTLAAKGAEPTGDFYQGLEYALSAMLVSPHFLYRVERAIPDPAHPGTMMLDDYSRATRLSMTLWNSTPNEMLLQAAAQGRLSDPQALAATAEAMTQSPRFEAGIRAFFADMLLFEKFDELAKDPVIYPYFSAQVAKAMPEQMLRTAVDHLVTREGDYRELFTTPRTFMNRSLAALYQVKGPAGSGWEPFEFEAGDDRAGLLGQAGFLALYSHSGRSSPTLRGRAIRELMMCQPVPDPPGNVNFTAVQDTANKAMPTARIRLTAHNTDPVCKGCHMITDPIGLSLEKFDGIGMARTSENDAPIDASGQIGGQDFIGAKGLGKTMAESPATTQCVASRALEYAVGMPMEEDTARIETLEQGFAASGYRIRELFRAVAGSPETYRVHGKPADNAPVQLTLAAE